MVFAEFLQYQFPDSLSRTLIRSSGIGSDIGDVPRLVESGCDPVRACYGPTHPAACST